MGKVIAWLVLMAFFVGASITAGILWGPDWFGFGLFISLMAGMLGAILIDTIWD